MKYLTFIVTLLRLLIASALLAIAVRSCAPNAHAGIRAEWTQLTVGQPMGHVNAIETDGHRLYAGTRDGVYISDDDGYTWRPTGLERPVHTMTVHQNTVYAGTYYDGVYRSDSHGNTWKPKNNGIRTWGDQDEERRYPSIRQMLVTRSGTVIALAYDKGTFKSTDRGETWHDKSDQWTVGQNPIGRDIRSMTEFDGYLWAATSTGWILRAPSDGPHFWDSVMWFKHSRITDWAVFDDRLYAAGESGFGRWSEKQGEWEYLTEGLPAGDKKPHLIDLAVNRGRIFAGLSKHGVYMFDERSETWIPAGLDWLTVTSLVSHQSDLYAATGESIYRASIPTVQPYAKAATTWSAIKRR